MKKLLIIAAVAIFTTTNVDANLGLGKVVISEPMATRYDIKIKNDSGNEINVINAGSGGTYRLQKNIIVTIKMEDGDKLYTYESGRKGTLLLTATADMDGKVQLLSKL